jgi:hypothetical protein
MKHPFITFAILLVAALLYSLGLAGLGVVALIVGGVFELWFWLRLLIPRRSKLASSSIHKQDGV